MQNRGINMLTNTDPLKNNSIATNNNTQTPTTLNSYDDKNTNFNETENNKRFQSILTKHEDLIKADIKAYQALLKIRLKPNK